MHPEGSIQFGKLVCVALRGSQDSQPSFDGLSCSIDRDCDIQELFNSGEIERNITQAELVENVEKVRVLTVRC